MTEQKKLFLESYFPNIMCAAIGVSSFFNFPLSIFSVSRDDIFNLVINALFNVLLIYLPLKWLHGILSNFDRLNHREVQQEYGFLYEGIRKKTRW